MLILNNLTSKEKLDELDLCGRSTPKVPEAGFVRFCREWCIIQNKEGGEREVPFLLFPGQIRVARPLCMGLWLWILKARQLGITWEIAAYTLWRAMWGTHFDSFNMQQSKEYAKDFIWRIKFIYDRLPAWMQCSLKTDGKFELEFGSRSSKIRAIASGAAAGRSMTADLGVYDEAAYITDFEETMGATHASLTGAAKGQYVVLSSSAGPIGLFYDGWMAATGEPLDDKGRGSNGFVGIFLHYSERPGRGGKWYQKQVDTMRHYGAHMVKREYPGSPEEAFAHAEERIWPEFSKASHVYDLPLARCVERYRAFDWGEGKSAWVCLWIAVFDGPSCLVVSPDCPNMIREILSYRRDPKTEKPIKLHNHTCDALRYAVVTFRLEQTVYVYREVYIEKSVAKGWTEPKHIQDVHRLSGWEQASEQHYQRFQPTNRGEQFAGSVADRSRNDTIALYNEWDIPLVGQRRPAAPVGSSKSGRHADLRDDEVMEGCLWVNSLVDGTVVLGKNQLWSRERQMKQLERQRVSLPVRVSPASTPERIIAFQNRKRMQMRRAIREKDRER